MAKANKEIARPKALADLLLDADNPRFGGQQVGLIDQVKVLDHIVASYGVDDVLSSLAVNGYFLAEPLVGREDGEKTIIVEGNRRLAACLILADDPRAQNQARKAEPFRRLWEKHGRKVIDPVPVISFDGHENDADLLSYLGVRHISASAPWDSFAKAHWASKVVANTELTVVDISTMIGDPYRTVSRLLEGYYVVQQAIDNGYFDPSDCVRRGRGSVTEYPFSWVYTIIGYTAARKYLGLPDEGPRPNPVPEDLLPNVRFLLTAMFGSQGRGLNSVVRDSRELGDLASALLDKDKLFLLEQGMALHEVIRQTKPVRDRLNDNLFEVKRYQNELIAVLNEQEISFEVANENYPAAQGNRRSAGAIEKIFHDILFPEAAE